MQNWIIILFGFAVIVFLVRKTARITNYPSQGSTIVAFGDSLILGKGGTAGNDFVSLLSRDIGEPIINLGVPGNTSTQGLDRIDTVLEKNPKVVIVLFGGNDYLRGVPQNITFDHIDTIVRKIQEKGAVVVLLGIQGGILIDSYASYFKEIASKRATLFVPDILEGIIGKEELMDDEIHPNDKGYKIIADKVLPVLKRAL